MDSNKGTGKKGKILWCSDLVTPTGFSRVAHSILKYIQDEYEITGVGVNYHGDPHEFNFPIFPAYIATTRVTSPYGENRVCELLGGRDYDVLFILNDAWIINKYLQAIKESVTDKPLPKIVVYFPVDSAGHDPEWYSNFDIVTKAVTYTEFGRWVVKDANPTLNVSIIPHGVDTSVFYKLGEDKAAAKEAFFAPYKEKLKTPVDDLFIVLNANRNQPRKKLDVTMLGFAKFAVNKPKNVKIYMHCGIVDSSINVDKLATRYNIADRLIVSSAKRGVQTVPDWRLNEIYNVCDVGINTSMGEGWGLTNVEHAVTGAAQIVPKHSACRELFEDCGLLMDTYGEFMFDNSLTVGKLVSPDEVAKQLEVLYNNPEQRLQLAERSFNKFTAKEYSWEYIAGQWREIFDGAINDTTNLADKHKGN